MKQLISIVVLFYTSLTLGQEVDKILPKANDKFEEKKYADAEADYRVSISKTRKNPIASYNLGNSIYRQNQASEAKSSYLKALQNADSKERKHQAFHNLGNVFMKEKNYSQAVESYKNALRNDPTDEESRYNYALAKKMLKDNPPKDDNGDKKKDKKEEKKDQKDKDKKNEKKDQNKDQQDEKKNGDQDKKEDKGNNDQPNNEPKPKPGGISKERLQNLLDAVNNEEKKIQDKVNAKKIKGRPVQTEKDW